MPLPTIYNTGTASVANGATTVTLVGAVSGAVYAGDLFCDPAQPLVPPQRIATDPVAGVFLLAVAWPGTSMVAAAYEVRITPDSVRIQERTREALNALQARSVAWKGPWVTATAYAVGDEVSFNNSSYICVVAHTSGTFATDLAAVKWQLLAAGISDGDKGDIVVSGSGTVFTIDSAASPQVAGLNVGHASDTTITRTAAGKIAVEGVGVTLSTDVREKLTAARTYYVRTDGSDSNTGLSNTSGAAFLTIAKALTVAATLDCSTFDLTIQVGDGTRTERIYPPKMIGSGVFSVIGNVTTPANCIISTTSLDCWRNELGQKWTIDGFELRTTTSGNCIDTRNYSETVLGANMRFGACASSHIFAFAFGRASIGASYTIVGAAVQHWYASRLGLINAFAVAVTLSGTPAFSNAFAFCESNSVIQANGGSFTGSATGPRYSVTSGGLLNTATANTSYLPGNAAHATPGTNFGASPWGLYL